MTNKTSLDSIIVGGVELTLDKQALTSDGAITAKNGVASLSKGSALLATLADPTDITDDGKILTIVSKSAQAHTVTSATSFAGAGTGADVATFGAAIGNSMTLRALGGKWYIASLYGVTVA